MSEESKRKLKEWADKLGQPLADIESDFNDLVAMFKKNVPGKTQSWYEDAARRRLFLQIKSDLQSPARPFDVVFLGYSGALDVAAQEIQEKTMLWVNPQTREQAVAEKKVYRCPEGQQRMTMVVNGKTIPVQDGTPLDTREWMTKPDPTKNEKGRKNRNYGKPLVASFIRNLVGIGRPATGGQLKLISAMEMGEDRVKLLPPIPPVIRPVRTRLNVRADEPNRYVCNTGTKTKFDPTAMAEIPNLEAVVKILETAPADFKVSIAELPDWHKNHERDARRTVILEGDVSRMNTEPTPYGSLMLVIEDASKEDLEAEGVTIWVPGELEEANQLDFGNGSRVFVLGRTSTGPGYNRETRQLDPSIERVMVNATAVIVIPEFRVPPEEESVVDAATVK